MRLGPVTLCAYRQLCSVLEPRLICRAIQPPRVKGLRRSALLNSVAKYCTVIRLRARSIGTRADEEAPLRRQTSLRLLTVIAEAESVICATSTSHFLPGSRLLLRSLPTKSFTRFAASAGAAPPPHNSQLTDKKLLQNSLQCDI
jgi:hypothetical protein